MKNTGFEYEILVQTIFQEIIKQEFAKNVTIRRDVKLLGKSGARHQIDVFWEFEIGGILYSTIVQVKDWKNSVKQEQILALKGVLDDLPRQPRGIIVTKKGFQRGAKKVAENHGIELFELKEIPKPLPLLLMPDSFANLYVSLEEGYFETIVYQVKYTNTTLILKNNCRDKSIITGRKYTCETLENSNLLDEFFYDSSFLPIKTFGKVMSDVANSTHKDAELLLKDQKLFSQDFSHKFESPTYFSIKNQSLPFLEIESINFTVEITRGELVKMPFSKPGITTFVLRNISDGKEKKFDVKKIDAI